MPDSSSLPPDAESAFDRAARRVLNYLNQALPLEFWSVSRVVDARQVLRYVTENPLRFEAGHVTPWSEALCQVMWEQGAPRIVPDLHQVDAYTERAERLDLGLASYVGVPLTGDDGALLGTLCALDRKVHPELVQYSAELTVLGDLLSEVLRTESRRQQIERELEAVRLQADTDALTGLLNRRAWDIACRSEQQRMREIGSVAGILVMDLDDLKAVNDAFGHGVGDDYLQIAGHTLRATLRPGDQVARLGGDEFGVLLPLTDRAHQQRIVGTVRSALQRVGVSASIGRAELDGAGSLPAAMRAADRRMYADKLRRRPAADPGALRQRVGGG